MIRLATRSTAETFVRRNVLRFPVGGGAAGAAMRQALAYAKQRWARFTISG